MSKKNRKTINAPRAIRRGGYVRHIATHIKRKGFSVRYEAGGRVARIIFAEPATRDGERRAA
jgi:hypothetical protein